MAPAIHPEPRLTWEIAQLFPEQGRWTEGDYLTLTHTANRLVEYTAGRIEILPISKTSHQFMVAFLYQALLAFTAPSGLGSVVFAPLRVRLPQGSYREPDIVFMRAEHRNRMGEDFWEGADLVAEVVSQDNRDHDLVTKREEYASAGIPEYWIVDPREGLIAVLTLASDRYAVHAEANRGQKARSALLPGCEVDATALLDAARS